MGSWLLVCKLIRQSLLPDISLAWFGDTQHGLLGPTEESLLMDRSHTAKKKKLDREQSDYAFQVTRACI